MPHFNLQPTLEGSLLHLRPLKSEDFDGLFSVASDPLIWEQHPENNRYLREVFEKFFQGALDSKGALVAVDSKTQVIIGSSRFNALDFEKNQVEVGYTFLARDYWGGNFNGEMKALMLAHAFQFVNRVVFYIGEHNLRSRRAIEKVGARLIGKIERQPKEGNKYFSVVYAVDKDR